MAPRGTETDTMIQRSVTKIACVLR